MLLITTTANYRWPEFWQEEAYFKANLIKKSKDERKQVRRKAPPEFFFPLLEEIPVAVLRRLLICSSLELVPVKRYPSWILSQTYNLKNRPVNFS